MAEKGDTDPMEQVVREAEARVIKAGMAGGKSHDTIDSNTVTLGET